MYIPKRLQQNFELSKEKHGNNIIVKGRLHCCGQYDFTIHYFGELRQDFIGQNAIYPKNDTTFLIAKCSICGKEIQVFNSYTDGYENCVNGYHTYALPELIVFPCPKCSKDVFSIWVTFEYQSKEELEEDGVQEYENAFSWIWVSPICSSCKREMKNLIDVETS